MKKDIFDIIRDEYENMSKGHKRIATYILENYDKAAFMTASKLGETVGVSESTTVRFATELNFDGYPALQRALNDIMRSHLTSVERIKIAGLRINEDDIFDKILTTDIERIRNTLEHSSKEQFYKAVDTISQSNTIYIAGSRSSEMIARFLSYYLNLIFKDVRLIKTDSESEVFHQLIHITSDDVVIGISFPRYSNHTITTIEYSKNTGAKVVAITDNENSPIAELADYKLIARSDMASFVDSLVAPLSLVNALIAALSIKNREKAEKNLEVLEEIWDKYDIYEKTGEKNNAI